MPIPYQCPNCQRKLKIPDKAYGKAAKCPACNSPIHWDLVDNPNSIAPEVFPDLDADSKPFLSSHSQGMHVSSFPAKSATVSNYAPGKKENPKTNLPNPKNAFNPRMLSIGLGVLGVISLIGLAFYGGSILSRRLTSVVLNTNGSSSTAESLVTGKFLRMNGLQPELEIEGATVQLGSQSVPESQLPLWAAMKPGTEIPLKLTHVGKWLTTVGTGDFRKLLDWETGEVNPSDPIEQEINDPNRFPRGAKKHFVREYDLYRPQLQNLDSLSPDPQWAKSIELLNQIRSNKLNGVDPRLLKKICGIHAEDINDLKIPNELLPLFGFAKDPFESSADDENEFIRREQILQYLLTQKSVTPTASLVPLLAVIGEIDLKSLSPQKRTTTSKLFVESLMKYEDQDLEEAIKQVGMVPQGAPILSKLIRFHVWHQLNLESEIDQRPNALSVSDEDKAREQWEQSRNRLAMILRSSTVQKELNSLTADLTSIFEKGVLAEAGLPVHLSLDELKQLLKSQPQTDSFRNRLRVLRIIGSVPIDRQTKEHYNLLHECAFENLTGETNVREQQTPQLHFAFVEALSRLSFDQIPEMNIPSHKTLDFLLSPPPLSDETLNFLIKRGTFQAKRSPIQLAHAVLDLMKIRPFVSENAKQKIDTAIQSIDPQMMTSTPLLIKESSDTKSLACLDPDLTKHIVESMTNEMKTASIERFSSILYWFFLNEAKWETPGSKTLTGTIWTNDQLQRAKQHLYDGMSSDNTEQVNNLLWLAGESLSHAHLQPIAKAMIEISLRKNTSDVPKVALSYAARGPMLFIDQVFTTLKPEAFMYFLDQIDPKLDADSKMMLRQYVEKLQVTTQDKQLKLFLNNFLARLM